MYIPNLLFISTLSTTVVIELPPATSIISLLSITMVPYLSELRGIELVIALDPKVLA